MSTWPGKSMNNDFTAHLREKEQNNWHSEDWQRGEIRRSRGITRHIRKLALPDGRQPNRNKS